MDFVESSYNFFEKKTIIRSSKAYNSFGIFAFFKQLKITL